MHSVYDRKQVVSWPDRISNNSLDHEAGGSPCPRSQLTAAMGTQSSPTPNTLLLATGRREWNAWSSPPLCVNCQGGTHGIFRSLLSWNRVILPEKAIGGLKGVTLERRGTVIAFLLLETWVIQGQPWKLLALGRTWVNLTPWNEGKAIVRAGGGGEEHSHSCP